ncbi:MFS domain-containing histidine kinase [Egibacter rhizosphaerae]|nr:MFS domain-containing histidine kinase [Egibacter rhizosphaerae]
MAATSGWAARPTDWRLRAPDDVLLRRFGYVRAVGGAAWIVAVAVLWTLYGTAVWPLALGVPILAIVTAVYFARSLRYPRSLLATSLVADALVLAGAVAFFGGTGSGLVMLQAIVIVSAGLLLGPLSAVGFTTLAVALGFGLLGLEQVGVTPAFFHRPDLGARWPILVASCAGLVSVGYLAATYGGRLHELIVIAGAEADDWRAQGRRRRRYVGMAAEDVYARVGRLEQLADQLTAPVDEDERTQLAARLRVGLAEVGAGVEEVADAAELDRLRDSRPEPIALDRVVADCLDALAERLHEHRVTVDVPPTKVIGDARGARRIVFNLLENVADHTSAGTRVHVAARVRTWRCVLAVTDDGPGVGDDVDPFAAAGDGKIGLSLVRELCEELGAEVRHQRPKDGGARFLVAFRLAPQAAQSREEAGSRAETDGAVRAPTVSGPPDRPAARGSVDSDGDVLT